MGREGKGRHNWRVVLDGKIEIGRWRATTSEKAIEKAHAETGAPIARLTAEDLGPAHLERAQRNRDAQQGRMVVREGKWVAESGPGDP